MTKEEWEKVKDALMSFYSYVVLDIDGYEVTLRLARTSVYKNEIAIYVNGVFKDEWLLHECEIRKRFLPERTKRLYSPAKLKKAPKYIQEEFKSHPEKYTITFYDAFFSSFRQLKSKLNKNNPNIKIKEIHNI